MIRAIYFDHDPEMGRPFLEGLQDALGKRSDIILTVLPSIPGGKEWDSSALEQQLASSDVLLIHPGLKRQEYVFNQLPERFPALRVGILTASPEDYVEERGNIAILPKEAYQRIVDYLQAGPAPVQSRIERSSKQPLVDDREIQPHTEGGPKQPTVADGEIELERLLIVIRHSGIPPNLEHILGERTEEVLAALEQHPEEGYRAARIRGDTPESVTDRYRMALVATSATRAVKLAREVPDPVIIYPRQHDQRLLDLAFQKLFDEGKYQEIVKVGWQVGAHPVLQAAGRKLYDSGDYKTAFIAAYNGDDKELLGQLVRPLLQAGHWEQVATAISSVCVARRPHGLTFISYSDPTLVEKYIPNARETLREVVETLVAAPLQRSLRSGADRYVIAHTLALRYVPELLDQARTKLIEADPKKAYHKGRGEAWATPDEELTTRARTALLEFHPDVAYETGIGNGQMSINHPYGPDSELRAQSREPFAKKYPERALQAAERHGDKALRTLALQHLLPNLPSELQEAFS